MSFVYVTDLLPLLMYIVFAIEVLVKFVGFLTIL